MANKKGKVRKNGVKKLKKIPKVQLVSVPSFEDKWIDALVKETWNLELKRGKPEYIR